MSKANYKNKHKENSLYFSIRLFVVAKRCLGTTNHVVHNLWCSQSKEGRQHGHVDPEVDQRGDGELSVRCSLLLRKVGRGVY
jgi:hypothetical protein